MTASSPPSPTDTRRPAPRPRRRRRMLSAFLALFILPIAMAAGVLAYNGGPTHWRNFDRRVVTQLPDASETPEARVLVMYGRTRGWKGAVAVHSWVAFKEKNGRAWKRYDVAGWGNPVRLNWWPPDLWFGEHGRIVLDARGERAEALIPRIETAVKNYRYANAGDYRIWPGPNSNSFVQAVLREIPEAGVALPPNAIGRDFRPGPYLGLTDSRTGVEASLYGVLGVKLGWVEGVELNVLGFVAGLDLRDPALKLPGFGRLGFESLTATAATRAP